MHEGGCLCGAVRYATQSAPIRVTVCHCRFCQVSTGSAYLIEPVFMKEDFRLVTGQPSVYQHRSEGSGKMVYIHFCKICGTKLYFTFERFHETVSICGGTFDDPNWFDQSANNARLIFLSAARHGTVIPAGIRCFQQHATANDGEPNVPYVFDSHHLISPAPGVAR